jgi:hypothetical protein
VLTAVSPLLARPVKRAHVRRPASSSTRAHAFNVAPVVLTSSTRTIVRPFTGHAAATRRRRARWRDGGPPAGPPATASAASAPARPRAEARDAAELARLVEAAGALARPMQRHGDDESASASTSGPAVAHARREVPRDRRAAGRISARGRSPGASLRRPDRRAPATPAASGGGSAAHASATLRPATSAADRRRSGSRAE